MSLGYGSFSKMYKIKVGKIFYALKVIFPEQVTE